MTSHLISLNTKNTTIYDVGNPDPDLGEAQKCDGIKTVIQMVYRFSQCFVYFCIQYDY
jgi:hypothetical protein